MAEYPKSQLTPRRPIGYWILGQLMVAMLAALVAVPRAKPEEGAAEKAEAGTEGVAWVGQTDALMVPPEWKEGDWIERHRLKDLESHRRPPPLEVSGWMNSPPLSLGVLNGRIVLLVFFSTENQPSLASIPSVVKLDEQYREQGVTVIGICASSGAGRLSEVVKKYSVGFPVTVDRDDRTAANYLVDGHPDYYLIDRRGFFRVVDARNGAVEAIIKAMLEEEAQQ